MILENGEITSVSYDARFDIYYANIVVIDDLGVIRLDSYEIEHEVAELISVNLERSPEPYIYFGDNVQ